jgi:hypothetical protein
VVCTNFLKFSVVWFSLSNDTWIYKLISRTKHNSFHFPLAAKMNGHSNEMLDEKIDEFSPNLSTLQMTGFLVPGKRLNNYCTLIINVVLYPLAILAILLEIFSNNFTLRTTAELLFITSSTCISFSRRIYFWRHGQRLTKLLECYTGISTNQIFAKIFISP